MTLSLPPEIAVALKNLLILDEGYQKFPKITADGKIKLGIGYDLTDRGISEAWINQQYEEDVYYFHSRLIEDFDWFKGLSDVRKLVLIDMCFMGYRKFLTFKRMLASLAAEDYRSAAREILDSRFAALFPARANRLAKIMSVNAL